MNLRLAIGTLALVLLTPLGALFAAPPKVGSPVIVFVPPWLDADRLVTLAGGQVIGPETAPLAVLAYSNNPTFPRDILLLGALGVRDGSLVARLCSVEVSPT
jgi:hypothetical protein